MGISKRHGLSTISRKSPTTSQAMNPETYIKNQVLLFLKKQNCWVYKSSDKFIAGIPDILACINGRFVAIELKTRKGRVAPLQTHTINQINKGETDMSIQLETYKCKRCGHEWVPRVTYRPKRCPSCQSTSWDTEPTYRRKKKEEEKKDD